MKWLKKFSFNKLMNRFLHKVECPLCLNSFYMRDTLFRCLNKDCKKEPDGVIEDVFSLKSPPLLGNCFSIPGKYRWQRLYREWKNGGVSECNICKKISHQHLCPTCHTPVPVDFWKYPTYFVLLLGSEKSGKSSYLTSLLRRLRNISADGYSFTFEPEQMYPSPWQSSIFRYKSTKTGETEAFVTFFELPGSSLETVDKLHEYQDYLIRADGFLVFLDPATFPGIGGIKKRLSETSIDTLSSYMSQLKIRKKRENFPPSAFVVTKLDLILKLLPKSTALCHDTEPKGLYDEGEGYQVSREVRGYLGTWSGPGILQTIICSYFRDPYRFFAIASDEIEREKQGQEQEALRVEEPFLWLFREMNKEQETKSTNDKVFLRP